MTTVFVHDLRLLCSSHFSTLSRTASLAHIHPVLLTQIVGGFNRRALESRVPCTYSYPMPWPLQLGPGFFLVLRFRFFLPPSCTISSCAPTLLCSSLTLLCVQFRCQHYHDSYMYFNAYHEIPFPLSLRHPRVNHLSRPRGSRAAVYSWPS
jgi:hypothetical protein